VIGFAQKAAGALVDGGYRRLVKQCIFYAGQMEVGGGITPEHRYRFFLLVCHYNLLSFAVYSLLNPKKGGCNATLR
jgi:hypothetical protein